MAKIVQHRDRPLESVGREVDASARCHSRDETVLAWAQGCLHKRPAAKKQVVVGDGGNFHADGGDVPDPLAAFAGGVVDQGILRACSVGFNAYRPDFFQ